MKNTIILLLVSCSHMASAQIPRTRDVEFVEKAAQDGLMEVKLGELAQTHAANSAVKTHGQHMVEDHGKANEELKNIANKKNITLPHSLSDKNQKKYNRFAELRGEKFDKKYSACMVKKHKKAICLFKKEVKKAEDPELQNWASQKLPTLKDHLTMWKETCKEVRK